MTKDPIGMMKRRTKRELVALIDDMARVRDCGDFTTLAALWEQRVALALALNDLDNLVLNPDMGDEPE